MPVIPKNCTQQDVVYNGQYGVVTDSNGLYYMRARYYNVDIKRFINQDVIEGSITNSPSLNKYAYCQGNPVSLLDPFGLSPQGSSSFGWHLLLDILGFVPVVGIFADIANGFWYLAEGNYAAAIGSFISAVPMIGDTVGIFTTAITGCTKMAKIIGYGTKLFSRVGNMALGVYEFSKNAYELYDRHKDPDFKWDKDTKGLAVNAAVSLAVAAVEAVGFARDIGNYNAVKYDIATSQCFVSGTLVLTSEGNKPIEEIKSGDLVYSTDPETGESEYKEVVQTFENETEELVHISVAGEEIVTTPKHTFYVPHKGWTSAIDLRAGDILVLSNGEYVIVEKVQHEILESPIKVYNFEVQEFHTYYVGENPVLVHNSCTPDNGFENWLNKGNHDNTVYNGILNDKPVYTGITKQPLDARLYQHNYSYNLKYGVDKFDDLIEVTSDLTRNQARSIEQFFIENGPNDFNIINSISPNHQFYEQALRWAEKYIINHGL